MVNCLGAEIMNWVVHDGDVRAALDERIVLVVARFYGVFNLYRCSVSCDHVPRRSWPLFRAKAMLGDLIAGLSSPSIQSHPEQSAA